MEELQRAAAGELRVQGLEMGLGGPDTPVFKDLFVETNPVPIKAALAMAGQIQEEYRLPLVEMNPKNRELLTATLKRCGVLK